MRIAMVSTPFVPVPPHHYGGTELVVYELVEGLLDRGTRCDVVCDRGLSNPGPLVRAVPHSPVAARMVHRPESHCLGHERGGAGPIRRDPRARRRRPRPRALLAGHAAGLHAAPRSRPGSVRLLSPVPRRHVSSRSRRIRPGGRPGCPVRRHPSRARSVPLPLDHARRRRTSASSGASPARRGPHGDRCRRAGRRADPGRGRGASAGTRVRRSRGRAAARPTSRDLPGLHRPRAEGAACFATRGRCSRRSNGTSRSA